MHDKSDAPALLTGVATTSLLISALRAAEAGRSGALFDDPLAKAVVAAVGDGDAARAWIDANGAPTPINLALSQNVAVRTRYFDDCVKRGAADGIRQVVILGSGMDGRSMRLVLPPETTFFEVDRRDVLAAKRRVMSGAHLTVRANVRPVAADLSRPDWPSALIAEGYNRAAPAIWLAEGLLYYLSQDGCARLLRAISDLCVPGSQLAAEFPEGMHGSSCTVSVTPAPAGRWARGSGKARSFRLPRGCIRPDGPRSRSDWSNSALLWTGPHRRGASRPTDRGGSPAP